MASIANSKQNQAFSAVFDSLIAITTSSGTHLSPDVVVLVPTQDDNNDIQTDHFTLAHARGVTIPDHVYTVYLWAPAGTQT